MKRLTVDFGRSGKSLIVSGDNGSGKSTLLRAIAMGLCDVSNSSALLAELPGDFIRTGAESGSITLDLRHHNSEYRIKTSFHDVGVIEVVRQILKRKNERGRWVNDNEKDFPWGSIFVAGYGAGARTLASASYSHYFAVDAVYTLFKYDAPLQNPELGIRRATRRQTMRTSDSDINRWKQIRALFAKLLNLERDSDFQISGRGVHIKMDGQFRELGTLGDGYRSIVTWIMDLISWALLQRPRIDVRRVQGVVLVDEIEQHLHPKWQMEILPTLRSTFPRIQFIVTTHSPLVISASSGVPVLGLSGEAKPPQLAATGWGVDDIYSNVMGVESARGSGEIRELRDKLTHLYSRRISGTITSNELRQISRYQEQLVELLPEGDPTLTLAKLDGLSRNRVKE